MRTLDYLEIQRYARQLQVQAVRSSAGKLADSVRHIIAGVFASGRSKALRESPPVRA